MRAFLLALVMLFCLPLQWASAATVAPCVHEPCAALHANLDDASAQATADEQGESHAQHPQCGSCHSSTAALSASAPFVLHEATNRLLTGPKRWTDTLMSDRPERPQWTALA